MFLSKHGMIDVRVVVEGVGQCLDCVTRYGYIVGWVEAE